MHLLGTDPWGHYHVEVDLTEVPSRLDPTQYPRLALLQVCNDQGRYGAGVSGAIARRWPNVESEYRSWAAGQVPGYPFSTNRVWISQLPVPGRPNGSVQMISMVAQDDIGPSTNGRPRLSYGALAVCLRQTYGAVAAPGTVVVMPLIGCGLGQASYSVVAGIVRRNLQQLPVWVCHLPFETGAEALKVKQRVLQGWRA